MAIGHLLSSPRDLLPSLSLSLFHTTILVFLALSLYTLVLALHRLYLSPISHIPGPRLAALTWWYEFYHDIVRGGQYTFHILALHRRYGPIVRINPHEIHVGDPDFYSEVYASPPRARRKWRFYTQQFGADDSTLATVDHELHRVRRHAIAPFFSTGSVRRLQPVIEERVDALLERVRGLEGVVDLMYPFSAFTNDVIEEYSFAKSHHLVESPDFGRDVTDSMLTGTHYGKWMQHVNLLLRLVNLLPECVSSALVPGWAAFLRLKRDIRARIGEIRAESDTMPEKWEYDVRHETVFHALLGSRALPPEEKTVSRLAQEGQILVQGGTLTTSWTLAIATFHLLDNPQALRRLRDELARAMPHADAAAGPPLAELEALPYLRAVVKESLRLGLGTSGRLARVAPDETLAYTDRKTGRRYEVPPGTPVSMTAYKTVTDDAIFPDPFGFRPERWLEDREQRLDRYLTVFGGGSRVCLGMALAQAELFLVLAKMFRVWGVEGDRRRGDVGVVRLFETAVRDCEMAADYFIPIPWRGTKGIRAVFEAF